VKILIAEDEYTTRLMVQVSLENWGYTVTSTEDGKEAWEYLKKDEELDIAILDWEMPGIDGAELCKMIKEMKRDNPIYVLLLTARDSQNDILLGFDAGADDYMTKPFNDNELRARVRVAERIVRIQSSLARTVEELRQALDLVDTLQGSIPVCSRCGQIGGDDNTWYSVADCTGEKYDPRFTPVICPRCTDDKD
jgi:DNA-binding response OmpR family regulator